MQAGTRVWPLGTYGEFVSVEADVDGSLESGFVVGPALSELPPGIPELDVGQIPWQSVSVLASFASFVASLRNDTITIDNSHYDGYWDYHGRPIQLDSAFKITVRVQTSGSEFGSIKLQDQPNRSNDPWWEGIRRLDIATDNDQLKIDIRDGLSEAVRTIHLPLPDSEAVSLTFADPAGRVFVVENSDKRRIREVDVTKLGLDLQDGLFPENKMYLGCVTPPNSKLTISSLSFQTAPSGKWLDVGQAREPVGLRQLARERGLTTGTDFSWWLAGDERYWNVVSKDFDIAIVSDFSSQEFWEGRGRYDFERVDNIVDWALRLGWQVRASHLVWGAIESKAVPDWLLEGQYSRDEYIQILEEHVQTVVAHYKGRVAEYSIANEAIGRSFYGSGADFWNDMIGPEYIEIAFRAAREADPQAILIFNDDNNHSRLDAETQRRVDKMYSTVKDLKSRGVPIDVVGMQMHLFLPWNSQIVPSKAEVIQTMQELASLGVDIYVTEFDVNLHGRQGSREERWAFEAGLYRDMMAACLESGVCKSFATWGVSDATSWLTCTDGWWCLGFEDADPLMFDKKYQPKPAYEAVYEALAGEQ